MSDEPRALVRQQIRNRIIEHFELTASFRAQRDYQANVPIADVPAEVICQWDGWYHPDYPEEYPQPLYSEEELAAMKAFQQVLDDVCDNTPDPLPALHLLIDQNEQWSILRAAGEAALKVFERRGKFDEDRYQFH